mgnify:CR=1 FL=1
MSEALGDFLARHRGEWEVLADAEALTSAPSARQMRSDLLACVGAHADDPFPIASGSDEAVLDQLRIGYRRILLGIAARDLSGLATMDTVAMWLSDLADCVLEAALAVARADVGAAADQCRFAVIGMGKCGARELNYVSDVDVIFVAEPVEGADEARAMAAATSLATGLMRACNAVTPEGTIWEVDAALRPEGKQGALVRTIASHVGYYERWAKTWEFQALLKARPVAGDRARTLGGCPAARPPPSCCPRPCCSRPAAAADRSPRTPRARGRSDLGSGNPTAGWPGSARRP